MFEDQRSCARSRATGTQYCDQFMHNENFQEFFSDECIGNKACVISMPEIHKFIDTSVDQNLVSACQSEESRFYLQHSCAEDQATIDAKNVHGIIIAVVEILSTFIVLFTVIFNRNKTEKMGRQYDELNLTASDYSLYINVSANHRYEFEQTYGRKIEERSQHSRGEFFKTFIQEKIKVDGINPARIDLVFDNKKMIDLLEARGNAIKLQ
jgi:hypothetical protein